MKLAPSDDGDGAVPAAGAPAPPRARRRTGGRGRTGGSSTAPSSRTTSRRSTSPRWRTAPASRRRADGTPGRADGHVARSARGTARRPTRRSCRTWSRRPTRCSTPSARSTPPTPDGDAAGRTRHLEEELGDLLFQIVFHARLAAGGGPLRPGRRGPRACTTSWCTATRTSSPTSRRTTPTQVVANWEEIKKEREGPRQRHRGHPGRLRPWCSRQAGAQGALGRRSSRPTRPDAGGAVADADRAGAGRRARTPHADDPLGARRGTSSGGSASCSSRWRDLARRARRRRRTGAARPRADAAASDRSRRAEGVPDAPRGATTSLVTRCPTRADAEGVTS